MVNKIVDEKSKELIHEVLKTTDVYQVTRFPMAATIRDIGPIPNATQEILRARWIFDRFGWKEDLATYDSYTRRLTEYLYYGDYLQTLRQRLNITHLMMECDFKSDTPVHISLKAHKNKNTKLDLFDEEQMKYFSVIVHPGQTRAQASCFLNTELKNVLLYINKENAKYIDIDPRTQSILKKVNTVEELMESHTPMMYNKYSDMSHVKYGFVDESYDNPLPCKFHEPHNTPILKAFNVYAKSKPYIDAHGGSHEKTAPAHPSFWYILNTFLLTDKYFRILYNNKLNIYTTVPEELEKANQRNVNALIHYFTGFNTNERDIVDGKKTRFYWFNRSFESLTEHKRNHFPRGNPGTHQKNGLLKALERNNYTQEDIDKAESMYNMFSSEEVTDTTTVFNFIQAPRATARYYVNLNQHKGFCLVVNTFKTKRIMEELMFLAHPDFTLSKTQDEKVMVINCEHEYWTTGKEYKEYIIDDKFLLG